MLTFNNKILTVSNKGLEVEAGPTPPPGPVLPFDYVQIGNQLWSLDVQVNDGGEGIVQVNVGTLGYPGQQINLGNRYYYTYAAASRIATAVAAEFPGWHVPSKVEALTLGDNAAVSLRATNGWGGESAVTQGTNTTGFTAYGTAYATDYTDPETGITTPVISTDKGSYYQYIGTNSYTFYINPESTSLGSQSSGKYYSLRLVKDA